MTQRPVGPRPLVEGALLAAIAVVLTLVGFYVPVIGTVVMFMWPVPVALVQLRHGLKVSILTIAVAGLVLSTLVGPLEAISMVATFGLAGLALGICIQRKVSPAWTVLIGAVAALASTGVGMLVSFIFLKVTPVQMLNEMTQALREANDMVGKSGFMNWLQGTGFMPQSQLEETHKTWETALQTMKMIFPATLVLSGLLISLLNFQMARSVLNRFGYTIDSLPPFERWRVPVVVSLGFIIGTLAGLLRNNEQWRLAYAAGLNLQVLTMMLFTISGAAVAYWFMTHRWNITKPAKIFVLVMVFFNPVFQQALMFLGILDAVFDWRNQI